MKLIARRYFHKKRDYANWAIERLLTADEIESAVEDGAPSEVEAAEAPAPEVRQKRVPLNDQRLDAVVQAVRDCGAQSVADLGCGEGRLLARLAVERQITRLVGMDASVYALERARDRLRLDHASETMRDKLSLLQGSLTYRDKRIEGFDAVCAVEVMEHMDEGRLPALERVVFEFAAPRTAIITTPNAEYNACYEHLGAGRMRHHDHRFEWTRAQFHAWAEAVCARFGYAVAYVDIGEIDEAAGAPTQMGVFTKCG